MGTGSMKNIGKYLGKDLRREREVTNNLGTIVKQFLEKDRMCTPRWI